LLPFYSEKYLLVNEDWKYDAIPEIWDGKNIADFIDPEIEERLLALEREEDELEAKGFYQSEGEMEDSDEEEIKNLASKIKEKKKFIVAEHRVRKNTHKNKPLLPRKANAKVRPPPTLRCFRHREIENPSCFCFFFFRT